MSFGTHRAHHGRVMPLTEPEEQISSMIVGHARSRRSSQSPDTLSKSSALWRPVVSFTNKYQFIFASSNQTMTNTFSCSANCNAPRAEAYHSAFRLSGARCSSILWPHCCFRCRQKLQMFFSCFAVAKSTIRTHKPPLCSTSPCRVNWTSFPCLTMPDTIAKGLFTCMTRQLKCVCVMHWCDVIWTGVTFCHRPHRSPARWQHANSCVAVDDDLEVLLTAALEIGDGARFGAAVIVALTDNCVTRQDLRCLSSVDIQIHRGLVVVLLLRPVALLVFALLINWTLPISVLDGGARIMPHIHTSECTQTHATAGKS